MKVSSIRSSVNFKQTVLLIDDQPVVLEIHTAILKSLKMNLKIVAMTSPVEALEWMKNKQVDLIVTDFRMHQMDGKQLVQAINGINAKPSTPVIVVTVSNDAKIHNELFSAGAAACLTKPVAAERLAEIAKTFLIQSQQHYKQNTLN